MPPVTPFAKTSRLPPSVNVIAGKVMLLPVKVSVRLRKLVSPEKLGDVAPAFEFCKAISRILLSVPLNTVGFVPKLLTSVFNKISESAAVTARVVVPPLAVIVPVWVILPPAVKFRFWPTDVVPMSNAVLFVRLASLAPVVVSDTAPLKLLSVRVRVIALAAALKLAVPETVIAPD